MTRLVLARFARASVRTLRATPAEKVPLGGYPGEEDKARELFPKLDQAKTREDFVAASAWLKARPDCSGKVGVVGFCYGGAIANMLATRIADLGGAVPFYGTQPKAEDVPKIASTFGSVDPDKVFDTEGTNASASLLPRCAEHGDQLLVLG
jgi:dienelactone hydrolase